MITTARFQPTIPRIKPKTSTKQWAKPVQSKDNNKQKGSSRKAAQPKRAVPAENEQLTRVRMMWCQMRNPRLTLSLINGWKKSVFHSPPHCPPDSGRLRQTFSRQWPDRLVQWLSTECPPESPGVRQMFSGQWLDFCSVLYKQAFNPCLRHWLKTCLAGRGPSAKVKHWP